MNSRFKNESLNILSGFIATLVSAILLVILRRFDTNTFLFLQLLLCVFVTYIFMVWLSTILRAFWGRELVAILLSFVLLSFLTLNIDRSRSFFLLKWVSEYSSPAGVTLEQIAKDKLLSESEIQAVQQRIIEQKQSVMLVSSGGNVRLTGLGKFFVKICSLLARLFNLKGYLKA